MLIAVVEDELGCIYSGSREELADHRKKLKVEFENEVEIDGF